MSSSRRSRRSAARSTNRDHPTHSPTANRPDRREKGETNRLAIALIVYGLGLGTAVIFPGLAYWWLILGCFLGIVLPWGRRQPWGKGVEALLSDIGSRLEFTKNFKLPWAELAGWFWILLGIVGFLASIYLQVRSPRPAATDISHIAQEIQQQNQRAGTTQTIVTLVRGQVRSLPRENRSGKARFWLDATQVSQVFEESRNLGGDGELGISAGDRPSPSNSNPPPQLPLDTRSRGVTGKLYVTVPILQATGLEPDQWVQVTGRLYVPSAPKNPGAFNFQAYLAREGSFSGLAGDRLERLDRSSDVGFFSQLAQFRKALVKRSVEGAGYPEGVVMAAMIMGRRAVDFPADLQDAFSRGGMAHVLATSGFHVSVLLGVVQLLVAGVRRSLRKPVSLVAGSLVLVGLVMLSGGTPSVLRAALMGIPILLVRGSDRQAKPIGLLLVVAAVLLLINPLWIQNLSFQLSFVATFGVLVSTEAIENRLKPVLSTLPKAIANALSGWSAVAISATLWILPLQLFYFAQISPYSIPVNVISVPLTIVITAGSFLTLACLSVVPAIGNGLAALLHYPVSWLIAWVTGTANLPGSAIAIGSISMVQLILAYAVMLTVWRWTWFHKNWRLFSLGLALILVLFLPGWQRSLTHQGITLLQTRSGIALVNRDRQNTTLVFDGNPSTANFTLLPFLRQQGITEIQNAIHLRDRRSDPKLLGQNWSTVTREVSLGQLFTAQSQVLQTAAGQALATGIALQKGTLTPTEMQTAFQAGPVKALWLRQNPWAMLLKINGQQWLLLDDLNRSQQLALLSAPAVTNTDILYWSGQAIAPKLLDAMDLKAAIYRNARAHPATVNQLENRETPTYNLDETGALFVPPQQLPSPILTDTISTLDAL
ncbi:MAG: ComEC/Rec2 family competence protein [Cyanobacteria bacterium P01_C01_bin.89]